MNRLPDPAGRFRSPPHGERPAFFRDEKSRQKNPLSADAFMEKLRRGKACRDPNSPLTGKASSAAQTGSLHRPWRIFPRLVFLIKPSEARSGEGVMVWGRGGVDWLWWSCVFTTFPFYFLLKRNIISWFISWYETESLSALCGFFAVSAWNNEIKLVPDKPRRDGSIHFWPDEPFTRPLKDVKKNSPVW